MITLSLLNPNQVPIQSWSFKTESTIKVGRATDNDVVLYSAVVSRRHIELRRSDSSDWEVVNVGTNGTYIEGKKITKSKVDNGTILRLAYSGPQILIRIDSAPEPKIEPKTTKGTQTSDRAENQDVLKEQTGSIEETLITKKGTISKDV